MKLTLKKYKYFVVIGLFFLAIYLGVPSTNYTNCLSCRRFEMLTIDGVVVNKYLDKSQHSTPIVEIEDFEGRIDSIYFFGEHSGLYTRIKISDTLKKDSDSKKILTKINNVYVRLGVADFKCDSVKLEDERYLFWLYELIGTVPSNHFKKKLNDEK